MQATEIKLNKVYMTTHVEGLSKPEAVRPIRRQELANWKRPGSETWFTVVMLETGGKLCMHPSSFTGQATAEQIATLPAKTPRRAGR